MYKTNTISLTLCLVLGVFIISGSTAAMSYAAPQKLPSCTDPKGQNLPCMMVISTLPPPPNALQCQETSGQLLPCSYATQNLSNGEQIVAITVYVPANFIFSSPTVIKVVVHEKESTKTTTKIVCPDALILNHTSQKCIDIPPVPPCPKDNVISGKCPPPKPPICRPGQHQALVNGIAKCVPPCERPDSDAKMDLDKILKTADCDVGDANEHGITPPPIPSCNSPNYNGTCLPTNNMTGVASGGKGTGSICAAGNCTTGTPTAVDCTKNPNDPSCTQTLTPSTTLPTTKTCPDGSVIDASATCPTQSTTPPTNPPPSSDNNNPPSTDNNPTPPSDNGNPSSSNSDKGGDKSGGGSDKSASQPGSLI